MNTQTYHWDLAVLKAKEITKITGEPLYLIFHHSENQWSVEENPPKKPYHLPYNSIDFRGVITPHFPQG